MTVLLNYAFTLFLIGWVLLSKKHQNSFVPLFISGFSGIPIYYFGRSSSGGIFPADIIAVTIIFRYGLIYGRYWVRIAVSKRVFLPFLFLTIWATFSTIYAITQTDYGDKYFLFLLYGIGRWWSFAFFVLLFFSYQFDNNDLLKIIKKLFFAFIIYGLFLVIHQYGLFNLSGREGLGPRIVENTQNILDTYEIKSMFWGSNRACVGAICFTGFWLAILLWLYCKEHNWRRNALILAILMIMGLIGSWSRSDFAALFISFILFILISKKKIGVKAKKIGSIAFVLIFNIWAIITILDINIEFPTLERFSVLFSEKWHEEGTGKYRIEMQKSIINYLLDNKEILLIGKGANGFRSLYGNEGIWSNAAHNTFLHNLTELGIVGIFLIMLFFYRILRLARFYSLDIKSIIFPILVSFILGRFISGYATDSFFAVDAMLPANIMLFGFIAVNISNIRFPFKKEIE